VAGVPGDQAQDTRQIPSRACHDVRFISPMEPTAPSSLSPPTGAQSSPDARIWPCKRLTLAISSLGSGGAERVMSILANHWAEAGVRVTLLVLDSPGVEPFYPLDPCVRLVSLGLAHNAENAATALAWNLRRCSAIRREIIRRRPDCVISFLDTMNVTVLLATVGLPVPVIVSERVHPKYSPIGRGWSVLRRITYPRASRIVVQTADIASYMSEAFGLPTVAIPNPMPLSKVNAVAEPERSSILLAMGRLTHQKGFDLLLDAFSRVAAQYPDWSVVIYGEGPERHALEVRLRTLKLQGRVSMPGRVKDPFPAMARAGLFVLPSRFEGFPNALCEAMAVGLPVIAADCPSGPADMITSGTDGVLVPVEDSETLATSLSRLMGDSALRRHLGARARQAVERFALPRIADAWNAEIARAIGGSAARKK
jgi:GalNAc-alpha-(1->4)-GalNAc-alpha-(1->3)-diNAcBac-PP-undecaprenol alpha-1,4-N-acetyl-D-galactosaminyltransferase